MTACHVCPRSELRELVDFGAQPVCNRYPRTAGEPEYTHPIALAVCETCGTVQIKRPFPASELLPKVDWITYNEPEGHLDAVAARVAQFRRLAPGSRILGISYKDDSTLARLAKLGFGPSHRLDPAGDLAIESRGAGIESIQAQLTRARASKIAAERGGFDLVVMRHVLEHAHDVSELAGALKALMAPGGVALLEVPDAKRALERCDYSTVWEEHIFYFTPATLRETLARLGFEIVWFETYPYTLENSLVALVRVRPDGQQPGAAQDVATEVARAVAFAHAYPARARRYREFLTAERQKCGKVALLGAGHLSATLINLLGLGGLFDFVVDDDPRKKGLLMPGSRLPIVGSEALVDQSVGLCFLSVRPEIEDKVIERNRPFVEAGGKFASIFPDSRYALPV